MADAPQTLPPIILETADTVRARMDSDATAGLDPSDSRFVDLTIGGMYQVVTQPGVLECVRLWDALTEMIAAMNPATAWGEYLDAHGATIGVDRKDEVFASGELLFTGPVGTLVPAGTKVSTVVSDPSSSQEAQEFETVNSITLAVTPGPTSLLATPSGSGGTIPAGIYYYRVTALDASGNETIASNEIATPLSGTTSSVALAWTAVSGATAYRVYRGEVVNGETFLHQRDASAETFSDDGTYIPTTDLVPTNRAGAVALAVGAAANVPIGTIILVSSPIDGGPAVTNEAAFSGGADVESDDQYSGRISLAYLTPKGGGVQTDYERWALSFPEIGFATVEPVWAGAGTVRVVVTDQSNNPVSAVTIQELQNYLDPIPGEGAGVAPIGAIVTVATPSVVPVTSSATVTFKDGYSLDGIGGVVAQRDAITTAIQTYLSGLRPGDDAILNKTIGQIMLVPGVLDVSTVHLNGSAANVTITALQVAQAGVVTLS